MEALILTEQKGLFNRLAHFSALQNFVAEGIRTYQPTWRGPGLIAGKPEGAVAGCAARPTTPAAYRRGGDPQAVMRRFAQGLLPTGMREVDSL